MKKSGILAMPPNVKELVIPIALFDKERYPGLTRDAILLYGILAAMPREEDQQGRECVSFSLASAEEILGRKTTSVRISFSLLRESGLIEPTTRSKFGGVKRYIVKEAK